MLSAVEAGRLRCPLDEFELHAEGWGPQVRDLLKESSLEGLDRLAVTAVLRAVLAERRHSPLPKLDLVWTGPEAVVSSARDTAIVVAELFSGAREEVLLGGYSFIRGAGVLRPLHRAMVEHGIDCLLFVHVERGLEPARAIAEFQRESWPFGDPYPKIYFDPRTTAADSRVSLHAKCIVVDRRFTFITSANFTDRGHQRNLEVGVLIEDGDFAQRLRAQWHGLISGGWVDLFTGLPGFD